MQLSFFQLDDPVLENIREELTKIDINTLTPIEALMKLNSIKKMIEVNEMYVINEVVEILIVIKPKR